MKHIILASKSPRRREILQNLGLDFEVVTCDTDESCSLSDPVSYAEELARRKGNAVKKMLLSAGRDLSHTAILSSDTVVCADGQILGKPADREDALRMLRLLSGREHTVISGVAWTGPEIGGVSHEVTRVRFLPLTDEQILRYLDSGEPFDKAGGYAIQGLASLWISGIDGDYFNVVGLPVCRMNLLYRQIFGENLR